MARRIAVEGTSEFLKKSTAELRVRRLLAEAIHDSLGKLIAIRMLPERARPTLLTKYVAPPSEYAIGPLGCGELPGIIWEPPPGVPRRRWCAIPLEDALLTERPFLP